MPSLHVVACASLVLLLCFLKWLFHSPVSATNKPTPSPAFRAFQRGYLLVYLLIMGADWLQGPYTYALYAQNGYDKSTIALLFTVGFATSATFGTFIGSSADQYGRKKLAVLFGVLYSLSCVTKHFTDFRVAAAGRVLSGISTSILHSAFESWMVSAHHHAGFHKDLLVDTFSLATTCNGLVAIAAGVFASVVREQYGLVAPFDASLVLLIVATTIILFKWTDNYGSTNSTSLGGLGNAISLMRRDRRVLCLGIVQSCFESSMYIFIFLWTPSLESTHESHIPHGVVFSSFMVCVLIGSTIFSYLAGANYRVERFTSVLFLVAALAMFLPSVTNNHSLRLLSFFLFECCCGVYWPALGTMRSRYIPEEVRATVMNVFRVPLNCLVVCVLNEISRMHETSAFALVTVFLLIGALTQFGLSQSTPAGAIVNADHKKE